MIEYIKSKEEWEKFWQWLSENFKNYEVIPESGVLQDSVLFKEFLAVCIYDWYHYKRINMEFMTVEAEQ